MRNFWLTRKLATIQFSVDNTFDYIVINEPCRVQRVDDHLVLSFDEVLSIAKLIKEYSQEFGTGPTDLYGYLTVYDYRGLQVESWGLPYLWLIDYDAAVHNCNIQLTISTPALKTIRSLYIR